MRWHRLILALLLIVTLIQPVLAQDDSETPQTDVPEVPAEPPVQQLPTSTPQPPATAGPAAPGAVLLSDNFDDLSAGRLARTSPDPAHYERGYAEGEYVLAKVDAQWEGGASVGLPGTFGNASLALDARIVGDAAGRSLALYCRAQPGSSLSGYVLLVLPADGVLRLIRFDNGTATSLTDATESTAVRRRNEVNRVELGCAGSVISATVNGSRILSAVDGSYQQGGMLVAALAMRATVQARLDNLVVTQVAEEAPPAPPRYDGTWNGSSTEGRANNFMVRNDTVVSITVDGRVEGTNCAVSGVSTLPIVTPARIENDTFSATATREVSITLRGDRTTYPATLTITMTGRFSSSTSASGETEVVLSLPASVAPCFASTKAGWTAARS